MGMIKFPYRAHGGGRHNSSHPQLQVDDDEMETDSFPVYGQSLLHRIYLEINGLPLLIDSVTHLKIDGKKQFD